MLSTLPVLLLQGMFITGCSHFLLCVLQKSLSVLENPPAPGCPPFAGNGLFCSEILKMYRLCMSFLLYHKALGSHLIVFAVFCFQHLPFHTAPEPDKMILHNPTGSLLSHQHFPSLWREPVSTGGESDKGETNLHP